MSTSSGLGTDLRWGWLFALFSAISRARTVMSAWLNSSTSSLARSMTLSGTPASLATWMP